MPAEPAPKRHGTSATTSRPSMTPPGSPTTPTRPRTRSGRRPPTRGASTTCTATSPSGASMSSCLVATVDRRPCRRRLAWLPSSLGRRNSIRGCSVAAPTTTRPRSAGALLVAALATPAAPARIPTGKTSTRISPRARGGTRRNRRLAWACGWCVRSPSPTRRPADGGGMPTPRASRPMRPTGWWRPACPGCWCPTPVWRWRRWPAAGAPSSICR